MDKVQDYVIALRRYFHENPELSGQEENTSRRVAEELDNMGIKYVKLDNYAVIGMVGKNKTKKGVLLRGDMDALKMDELADVPYKSKNQGVMHSCGHDGHTAMLLGAAKILKEKEDQITGCVYLCFQPAEEIGLGAQEILDFVKEQDVEIVNALGIHLWSLIPVGKINVEPGPKMASGDSFEINIKGAGGHGARLDQTIDPIRTAVGIYNQITSIPTNYVSTLDPCVVSVGTLQGGTASNIIPHTSQLTGTIRTFSKDVREQVLNHIERMVKSVAQINGSTAEFIIRPGGVPPVINHDKASEVAKKVIAENLGESFIFNSELLCASENFGLFTDQHIACMAFVGCGNDEKQCNYPHHHPKFNIDEDALHHGTVLYSSFALEALKEG